MKTNEQKEILDYDETVSNNDDNNNNGVGIHHPSDHYKITDSDSKHPSIREQHFNDEIPLNTKDASLTPFVNNEHDTEAVRSLPNSANIENFNSKHPHNRDKHSDAENPVNSENLLKDSNYNAAPAHYPSSPVKLAPDKNSKIDQKVSTMMEDFKVRKTILKDKASNKETNIVENENQKVVDKIQVFSSQGKKTPSDVEEMGVPEEVGEEGPISPIEKPEIGEKK
ncbi:hypothetical protein CEXT_638941 [Caerostris extrusa]|uniref:Uncharacterized protein n=1 Tax=Caerostris extrusa TaxID=172846 RepID=A0AAV4R295_CAEEX|nr:hypothetical protein CEXT_638941 [Caerostris extrusa]